MGLGSLRHCSSRKKELANLWFALPSHWTGEMYVFKTVDQSIFEL